MAVHKKPHKTAGLGTPDLGSLGAEEASCDTVPWLLLGPLESGCLILGACTSLQHNWSLWLDSVYPLNRFLLPIWKVALEFCVLHSC